MEILLKNRKNTIYRQVKSVVYYLNITLWVNRW